MALRSSCRVAGLAPSAPAFIYMPAILLFVLASFIAPSIVSSEGVTSPMPRKSSGVSLLRSVTTPCKSRRSTDLSDMPGVDSVDIRDTKTSIITTIAPARKHPAAELSTRAKKSFIITYNYGFRKVKIL